MARAMKLETCPHCFGTCVGGFGPNGACQGCGGTGLVPKVSVEERKGKPDEPPPRQKASEVTRARGLMLTVYLKPGLTDDEATRIAEEFTRAANHLNSLPGTDGVAFGRLADEWVFRREGAGGK